MISQFKRDLPEPEMTDAAARALACALEPGLLITLTGPVGAGKTSFVRALLRGLNITGPVRSPTYTLVEPYITSNLYLYHFDLYRFFDPLEWEASGFRDLFDGVNIQLVEWPEKAAGVLPVADIELAFSYTGSGRQLVAQATGHKGITCLSRWVQQLP
jgi:tRNA threonylcarbamoyladenosine biosynthesis protein TsaE